MNLGQFETAVAGEIGLSVANEKTTIDNAINRAVQRVLEDTHCYVTSESLAVSSLTALGAVGGDYAMPAEWLAVNELYTTSGGTISSFERLSDIALIEKRRVSQASGTPAMYYATSGDNMLMLWPTPAGTDTVTAYYVPTPAALSGASDDPATASLGGVPEILHEAVFLYACKVAASFDDDQTSAQGQRYLDWYDKEITRYKKIVRKRGGQRNARARVNDKRRRSSSHDNSTYPG